MTEITRFAQLAVRAADLADRCEAAGALVVVALLREITQEVEEAILGLNAAAKRFMLAKTQLERLEAEAAERPKRPRDSRSAGVSSAPGALRRSRNPTARSVARLARRAMHQVPVARTSRSCVRNKSW